MSQRVGLMNLVSLLNEGPAAHRRDSEYDALLAEVSDGAALVAIIDSVDVHLDSARALYRAALRIGGAAVPHARWLLAGALSLEGLDDVAHAVEPEQQRTGLIKRSFEV